MRPDLTSPPVQCEDEDMVFDIRIGAEPAAHAWWRRSVYAAGFLAGWYARAAFSRAR